MSRSFIDLLTPEEEALIRLGADRFMIIAQSKPNIIRIWLANKVDEYLSVGGMDTNYTSVYRVTRFLGKTKNKDKRANTLQAITKLGLSYALMTSNGQTAYGIELDWSLITKESEQP